MHFKELDTPSLLIDLDRMDQNITRMADLSRRNDVRLRPHTKTHKCPEIAKIQIETGAEGITCAKLGEAEVMAAAGIKDILIANQIIGEQKLRRLMTLSQKTKVTIAVDSLYGAETLNNTCKEANTSLDVLIEINTGQNRCGVLPGNEALSLAKEIGDLKHVNLQGIMTHAGHVYNQKSLKEIENVGLQESKSMVHTANLLRDNGIEVKTISVGSTPAASYCSSVEGITEIRPGTYIFNDLSQVNLQSCGIENCALFVLATVISRPSQNRAIIDAGKKVFTSDSDGRSGNNSGFGLIVNKNTSITRLSEEHGVIESDFNFKIGEKVCVIPNHACVVVNMFDKMYGFRGEKIEKEFTIAARGKIQ